MIKALILRRLWLLRHRLAITAPFVIIIPICLHLFLSAVIEQIYTYSPNGIPMESWLFPGIVFSFASLSMLTIIYRDLFSHQINSQFLKLLAISPNSKFMIILSILLSSLIECLIYSIAAMVVLVFFLPEPLPLGNYFIILSYLILYLILIGSMIISLSLIIQRVSIFLFSSIIVLQLLFVGSNLLFENQIYSEILNMIFFNNLFSMLLSDLRSLIFFDEFNYTWIAISLVVAICWLSFNAFLLKRKLKQ